MANRRMFSKTITSASAFLMMPPTSRLLYYDLGMNADDDGFCEHFTIMRMTEASPDDLRVLEARGFIKIFDDKVLVIRDWKENNYIQKDRYTPSKYLEIYKKELKLLAKPKQNDCIQDVSTLDTQVRLGKDRLGKVSIGKDISSEQSSQIKQVLDIFYKFNPTLNWGNKTNRSAAEFMIKKFGLEETKRMAEAIRSVQGKPYAPVATTPYQMKEKLAQFKIYFESQKNNKPKIATI